MFQCAACYGTVMEERDINGAGAMFTCNPGGCGQRYFEDEEDGTWR